METSQLKDLLERNNGQSNEEIIKYLDTIDIYDICFPHGENVLHFAAAYNNIYICKYLIECRHIVSNLSNARGATPLYYASMSGSYDAVEMLLYNGTDPRIRSGFSGMFPYQIGKTPEIRQILADYEHTIPIDYDNNMKLKKDYTLYQSYRYRLHRYWLTMLDNAFLKKHNFPIIEGAMVIDEAKKLFNSETYFEDILEKYKTVAIDYLFNINETKESHCLYCSKNDDLKRCKKCKSAHFCNKTCQSNAFIFHNYDCH